MPCRRRLVILGSSPSTLFHQAKGLTHDFIGAAIEVRKDKGPGIISYMKLLDIPLGLIINFNVLRLTEGISRLILPGANLE